MKMIVKVVYIGIPHYFACCHDCDWEYEDYTDRRKGQREIRKHVRETGHTVALEKSVIVHYVPAENGRAP